MEAVMKSSFLYNTIIPFPTPSSSSSKPSNNKPKANTVRILCSVSTDPWTLSDGQTDLNKPKPKSKRPKNPLSDDNARRIIKAKALYLSALRRNQGSRAQTPKWIKRTPEQMVQYLEDDSNGHLYGKHVVAAIKKIRSLSWKPQGSYDMRQVMGSFVAKLTFRDMCIVLKEQKGWRQVSEFFAWMKLQLSYRPSVIVYTIILRAYGQVGKIKLAEQTFLEMLEAGCEADEVACGTMLCAYARWGRHKGMLSFYSTVRERGIIPSTSVFNFILSSLQKKSLHEDVLYMWRQMTDNKVTPNHFTYAVVISSLVKQGMNEEAFETFNEMKNLGFAPEEATYSLLISLSSKMGNHGRSFWLYEDMRSRGIIPSNFTCASLLASYYKDGDYSKALSLFLEMEKYGIAADEVIYGLIIRIYGKLGLYEDAERTFNEVENLGLLKDEKTYTTMAQVHLHSGNVGKALIVISSMKSKNIPLSKFGLIVLLQCYVVNEDLASAELAFQALSKTGRPDCGSCSDMLNLYMKCGLMDKATAFVVQLRKAVEFDEELLKTVMKLYYKETMRSEVECLLKELKANKRLEDSAFFQALLMDMCGRCHSLLLDQHGASAVGLMLFLSLADGNGKKTQAKLKFLLATANGLSVASQLLCKLAREGDLSKAEFLYGLLINLGRKPDVAASISLINLYAKQQKFIQARQIFAATVFSFSTSKYLYASIMEAYCKWGNEEEGYLFYKEEAEKEEAEKGHDLGPVAISMLVNALTNCGKHLEAEKVICNTFQLEMELDTVAYNTFIKAMLEAVPPSIQTYNTMISVYGRRRNLGKAVDIFTTARSVGMPMDEKADTNLICYYGKAGKCREASHLFDEMQKGGIKPGKVSYNVMISICGAGGLYDEAAELFRRMRHDGCSPDSFTYLCLIRAYTKGLEYAGAEKTLSLMQKEGISPSCAHFNEFLVAYAKAGLMKEAERTYRELITTGGISPDLECNRTMLRGYMDYGCLEDGISFFERIEGSVEPDRFIMSAAVSLYRAAGMELRAEELLKLMHENGIPFLEKLEVGSKRKKV